MPKYKTIKSSDNVHRLTLVLCSIAPLAVIIVLNLLAFIPFWLTGSFWIGSDLALASVFYWAVYAPARFKLLSAAVAGFLSDILFMTPFGSQIFIFSLMFYTVTKLRRLILPKSFKFVWLFFMLISVIVSALLWTIISLVNQKFCAFVPILENAFIAWLCYPLVVLCCNTLLKILQRFRPYE